MVNDLQDVPVGYKHGRGRQYNKTHKGNKFMSRGELTKSEQDTVNTISRAMDDC